MMNGVSEKKQKKYEKTQLFKLCSSEGLGEDVYTIVIACYFINLQVSIVSLVMEVMLLDVNLFCPEFKFRFCH